MRGGLPQGNFHQRHCLYEQRSGSRVVAKVIWRIDGNGILLLKSDVPFFYRSESTFTCCRNTVFAFFPSRIYHTNMQSFFRDEKIQTWIAVVGAMFILLFLFIPLPDGRSSSAGSVIYMVNGTGEQWPMLIFAIVTALMVYFKFWYGAFASGVCMLLTTVPLSWRYFSMGMYSVFGNSHPQSISLSPFQLFLLVLGVTALCVTPCLGLWNKWSEEIRKATAKPSPRRFDPRTIDPLATTGFCYNCGSKNPLSRNQCLRCNVNLSWLGASTPTVMPRIAPRPAPKQDVFAMPSVSVDWTVLGIGIISFLLWPLGLVLFFAFSKTDEEKGNAAIIGACLALAMFVLRFVYMMATAVH